MISREDFDAYSASVDRLIARSADEFSTQMGAWLALPGNESASVGQKRAAANEIMSGVVQRYSDAAATLAAEWYDSTAEAAHVKLPSAITVTSYSPAGVDKVARYQARWLREGSDDKFVSECCDYVGDCIRKSLNQTILRNCQRDRGSGVRFARVPTGRETCPWCYMLASRGAVYYSRKSAGEQAHWHRNCDCKIVQGFENERDAEIVEGYDPKGMRDRMGIIERETGLSFAEPKDSAALKDALAIMDPDWLYFGRVPEPDYSLAPRTTYGTLKKRSASFNPADYDLSNFMNEKGKGQLGNEWRDVFVHDALANAGIRVVARPTAAAPSSGADSGITSPDVWINGAMWEIKSPQPPKGEVKPGNELNFIKSQFRVACNHNFKNPLDVETGSGMGDMRSKTRVIISTRYRDLASTPDEVSAEIRRYVGNGPNKYATEAIWIDASGKVRIYG